MVQEFYRKCVLAHESLTGQMDWAQAQATQSRERVIMTSSVEGSDSDHGHTLEEQTLASLFEAHSALAESLMQYDDLEILAVDERELKEARERSRQETKMGNVR